MTNELISSKYTFVCDPDECDSLIELTSSDGFGFPSGVTELTCPCGRKTTLLSVEHATIAPSNQTKEETMNGMIDEPLSDLEKYNPDLLVTYKVIKGYSDAEYTTDKVRNIEWELHNARGNARVALDLQNKIDLVKSIIINTFPDSDDQETLTEIAQTLGIELTKEITWEATIHVSGTMQVSLTDSDYDFESELNDNLFVDSQNGDIEIGDYEVANVQEAY
jgi:hypothetical protein